MRFDGEAQGPHSHRMWVQVPVTDGQYCTDEPRLIGGIDPEKAREALRDLKAFRPGYGPDKLFNDDNPLFESRHTLREVLEDNDKNPDTILDTLKVQEMKRLRAYGESGRSKSWAEEHGRPESEWFDITEQRINKRLEQQLGFDTPFDQLDLWSEVSDLSVGQITQAMKGDEDAHFLSEGYLYPLVGKEIARSILGRLRTLESALGLDS